MLALYDQLAASGPRPRSLPRRAARVAAARAARRCAVRALRSICSTITPRRWARPSSATRRICSTTTAPTHAAAARLRDALEDAYLLVDVAAVSEWPSTARPGSRTTCWRRLVRARIARRRSTAGRAPAGSSIRAPTRRGRRRDRSTPRICCARSSAGCPVMRGLTGPEATLVARSQAGPPARRSITRWLGVVAAPGLVAAGISVRAMIVRSLDRRSFGSRRPLAGFREGRRLLLRTGSVRRRSRATGDLDLPGRGAQERSGPASRRRFPGSKTKISVRVARSRKPCSRSGRMCSSTAWQASARR